MADLKGTKTEKNLQDAFAGESMARNKYTFFAAVAKKEGFEQIAAIFQETADQEKTHAKLHFKLLQGIGDTQANLTAAAAGETHEWTSMYPTMAKEAREEGFDDVARHFENVGKIELTHKQRYEKLLANLGKKEVFARPGQKVVWVCRECGFSVTAEQAPGKCPVCSHPQAFFQLKQENY